LFEGFAAMSQSVFMISELHICRPSNLLIRQRGTDAERKRTA
jgi:hypothetical protein